LKSIQKKEKMALRNKASSMSKAVFVQLFRNQQQITSSVRLSTIGDGNRHGKKRKQERVAGAFHSPSAQGTNLQPAFFKPKCLIFDKDGTLVCFHTMWSPWATDLAERMSHHTGLDDLDDHVYDVLGYDHKEKKVGMGALAENTHPQIKQQIEEMLELERGFCKLEAKEVVNRTWKDTPDNMSIKLTGDLHSLFYRLKCQGVRIAICTSDSREGTEQFLVKQNLKPYIDMIVCGDDKEGKPKPDPHNALYICDKLGVRPSDTIMVGDTPADTLMGQQAKLGLTVGVLTGVGNIHDLIDADVIVSDVKECIEMVLPQNQEEQKVHHITTRGLSKIARGSLFFHSPNDVSSSSGMAQRGRMFSTSARAQQKHYSHIVVGAGSAGCVLSNRISENRSNI